MKRIVCFVFLFSVMLSLCACGSGPKGHDPTGSTSDPAEETAQPVGVDDPTTSDPGLDPIWSVDVESGLFDVTITVPADFLDEGTTQEQLDAQAKDSGFKSITLNDDGSATYVMTKSQHKEMVDGISQSIEESLSEMANSEEYPNIVRIETNGDYTQYKVYLNTEEVGLSESIAVLGFYMFSGMYHVFNGTEPGNVNIQYISEATGGVIEEANSSDMG